MSDTPGSTEEGHGCGETAGSTAHQRLDRSPGQESSSNEGLIGGPDGAEVIQGQRGTEGGLTGSV